MKTIIVPRHSGFAVLDGKHNMGGPLDIPAGEGQYGEIFFDVQAGDDIGFLGLTELSGKAETAKLRDLVIKLFNAGGTELAVAPERVLGVNYQIIPFDTETKSNMVKKLTPGRYSYRLYDKHGHAHSGLVCSLLQTIPH